MNGKIICPECGSSNVITEKITEQDLLPFGASFEYEKEVDVCQECGEKGSFSNKTIDENHERYQLALKETNKDSLVFILHHMSELGNSMAHIERSLGLAQRTLSRWKTQSISGSGMTLMRIICAYPWILDVADENFDEKFANEELLRQAAIAYSKFLPMPDEIIISETSDRKELQLAWINRRSTVTSPITEPLFVGDIPSSQSNEKEYIEPSFVGLPTAAEK